MNTTIRSTERAPDEAFDETPDEARVATPAKATAGALAGARGDASAGTREQAAAGAPPAPLDAFVALLDEALRAQRFDRLVLSKPRGAKDDLTRVTVRAVVLKGTRRLVLAYSHRTRDITRHVGIDEAPAVLSGLLADVFAQAQLFAGGDEAQLLTGKKGRRTLLRRAARRVSSDPVPNDPGVGPTHAGSASVTASTPATALQTATATARAVATATATAALSARSSSHDRPKRRVVDPNAPFLTALGVTDAARRLVPAMARKWKQINKFVEVLDHALDGTALDDTALATTPLERQAGGVNVVDFGSGKGYLTFAMHAHLRQRLGGPVRVTGVELREDMVAFCNAAAERLGLDGLRFAQGDVRSVQPPKIDIMVALHACDTATDHAIATGLRAGAAIIMCSPCCHKELRPQLLSPHPLRPILKHGVHLGQQAEMLTDTLRAMVLEACGYETRVFEFVALEHSQKNKMILAVRRERRALAKATEAADTAWRQIDELKAFYGIRTQCLEALLQRERVVDGN